MATNARGTHVSPGIYTREVEVPRNVENIGSTTLGVVGETLKGPAFEPIKITNWEQFKSIFGDVSADKFVDTQYPKYELPYIAKEWLSESESLEVVRVLGLCGYNAGPAWLITAAGKECDTVIAVIRSRGMFKKYFQYNNATSTGSCDCQYQVYDRLIYTVGSKTNTDDCKSPVRFDMDALCLTDYQDLNSYGNECEGYKITAQDSLGFNINSSNYGKFCISGHTNDGTEFRYNVSLNPGAQDYILSVLGTDPLVGDAPIFVESLYDTALIEGIDNGTFTQIVRDLVKVDVYQPYDFGDLKDINGAIEESEGGLNKRMAGNRLIADKKSYDAGLYVHPFDYRTNKPMKAEENEDRTNLLVNVIYFDSESEENPKEAVLTFNYDGTFVSSDTDIDKVFEYITEEDLLVDTRTLTLMHKAIPGQIHTVKQYTNNGTRNYVYSYYPKSNILAFSEKDDDGKYKNNLVPIIDQMNEVTSFAEESGITVYNISHGYGGEYVVGYDPSSEEVDANDNLILTMCVKNKADGNFYRMKDGYFKQVRKDLNDYRSQFSHAITPWIVSNVKGSTNIELSRMFRFHTITDGNCANEQVKVSIANIRPEDGTFDVYVRNIYDSDGAASILEKFSQCNMIPGSANYIAYKIGSFDGMYESKSKYITVEVKESDINQMSVPCGFVGYPTNVYSGLPMIGVDGNEVSSPDVSYNIWYDSTMKARRQYFGLSDLQGIDVDFFTYKGRSAYVEDDTTYLGKGFHLDCRVGDNTDIDMGDSEDLPEIFVDGKKGYMFTSVDESNRTTELPDMPIISTEQDMETNIYSDINLRKFTVYFYGGFDGWNPYRGKRTTADEFTRENYKGVISTSNGEGVNFGIIKDNTELGLTGNSINSDYYAFLAGYRKFSNPSANDIDLFATPGIDYVYDTKLVEEVIEMLEEERHDALSVFTTPDKPQGASDAEEDMFDPSEVVSNLEDTNIDTTYGCTYYPWVKYHDTVNNKYIMLPPTKDVLRSMAFTDNVAYPWVAPAGMKRGDVNCVKAHKNLRNDEEDTLYANKINPIKSFTTDGVKIWGQKVMSENYEDDSRPLSRIHVRRMMLALRKQIMRSCFGLLFDPNDDVAVSEFRKIVNGILENVRINRGISDYNLEIDTSSEARARREMPAKVFIKPLNMLEYIPIDFILTPEGVSFEDI